MSFLRRARRAGFVLLVASVLAAAYLVLSPSAQASPLVGFNDISVGMGTLTPAQAAQLQAQAGATIDRVPLHWDAIEPTRGTLRLGTHDQIYAEDLARGVRPLFILMFAPSWTWASGTQCTAAPCRFPPGPNNLTDWRGIVTTLVKRYPQMAGLEIWNEPNLQQYWSPGPQPEYYAKLVAEAKAAVRTAASTVPIIAGSLSNYAGPDKASAMHYRTFLDRAYAAGLGSNLDGLSFHPYPGDVDLWRTFSVLSTVRELQLKWHDTSPLWITEVGQTTTGGAENLAISEPEQGAVLRKIIQLAKAMPNVKAIVVHSLVEGTYAPEGDPERGYGVLRPDLTPKPAYCAIAAENGAAYTCPAGVAPAVVDAAQERRWDAQVLLQAAADAGLTYRNLRGGYTGLDAAAIHALEPRIAATPAGLQDLAGPGADPSRVYVQVIDADQVLLCNASRADKTYCILHKNGAYWRYGALAQPIWLTGQTLWFNNIQVW
jgi:hypothetical protein